MSNDILITVPTLMMGGMENSVLNFAKELTNQGFSISILMLSSDKVFYAIPSDIKIYYAKKDYKYKFINQIMFLKTFYTSRKICKTIKPRAVFSFSGRHSNYVTIALLGLNLSVFIFHRSSPNIRYNFLDEILRKITYPLAEAVIVQTKLAKEIFERKFRLNRVYVHPNPIDTNRTSNTFRKENIIISFGRLVKGKRIGLLIDVFHNLGDTNWELHIVGDGQQKEKLKSKVRELDNPNIKFFDKTKNIEKYLDRSKIFAFTSESEGFPNALLEAMCHGLACISFDCVAGPSDLIRDDVNGYLVEINNNEEYSNKLQMLMTSDETRLRFSKEALKLNEIYNSKKIIRNLMEELNLSIT